MQRLQAHLQVLLVRFIPLRDAGIYIPTVVVEARLLRESTDLGARFLLDVSEADHDVGYLHSGVIDIVLHVDFPARAAQKPDECVAENGIAEVTDVRGLVGIDARVLNQDFSARSLADGFRGGGESGSHPCPIDTYIQIAGGSCLHFCNAFDGADIGTDSFCDFQWGGAKRFSERKNRNREVSEFDLWRLFDDHPGQRCIGIAALQTLQHALGKTMFQVTIQESL